MYGFYYYPGLRFPAQQTDQPVAGTLRVGDVNGDGVPDFVYITAVQPSEQSPFWTNITLKIQDGATRSVYSISLDPDGNAGYDPTVFLGDFTKDGIPDILVSIYSGGSGAFTYNYVYSFVNNQAHKLFDYNAYNQQNKYEVEYLNGYKVRVTVPSTRQFYIIDISGRSSDYLSPIYNADGTLKQPIKGDVNPVSGFYPVDMEKDGRYEIQAFQKITGLYNADSLGYVINVLQWDGRSFGIWQQWIAIFGNEQ